MLPENLGHTKTVCQTFRNSGQKPNQEGGNSFWLFHYLFGLFSIFLRAGERKLGSNWDFKRLRQKKKFLTKPHEKWSLRKEGCLWWKGGTTFTQKRPKNNDRHAPKISQISLTPNWLFISEISTEKALTWNNCSIGGTASGNTGKVKGHAYQWQKDRWTFFCIGKKVGIAMLSLRP